MMKILPSLFIIYRVAIMILALSMNVATQGECGIKLCVSSASGETVNKNEFGVGINSDTGKGKRPGPGLLDNTEVLFLHEGENAEDKIRKNLFIIVNASKTNCFPGETILVTYKLYSRVQAKSAITKQPQLNGFAVYDMIDHISINESIELYNGKRYKVHTLKKAHVVPLQTGKLKLDRLELETTVGFIKGGKNATQAGRQLNNILDQFLMEEKALRITAKTKILNNSLTISVMPFPEHNRPANFDGAVGNFVISANIPSANITTNNPAVLEIDIKGDCYAPLISEPVIHWPMDIDSFDVNSSEEINYEVMPLQGRKTLKFTFVPTRKGRYKIPSISFCFFDPSSKSYKVIETPPTGFQVLDVTPGTEKHAVAKPTDNGTKREAVMKEIHTKTSLKEVLSTLFCLMMCLIVYRIYIFRSCRKAIVEPGIADAHKISSGTEVGNDEDCEPLKRATELLRKGDHQAFCRELNNVLWDALALKLSLPLSELNKQNIAVKLMLRGWNNDMIGSMKELLTECERNIYITGYNPESGIKAKHHLQLAGKILDELERV